jgi:hypothetical protein
MTIRGFAGENGLTRVLVVEPNRTQSLLLGSFFEMVRRLDVYTRRRC